MTKAIRRVRLSDTPSTERIEGMREAIDSVVNIPANIQTSINTLKARAKTDEAAEDLMREFSASLTAQIDRLAGLMVTEYQCDAGTLQLSAALSPRKQEGHKRVFRSLVMCYAQQYCYEKVIENAIAFNAEPKNKTRQKKARNVFAQAIDECYAALYAQPIRLQFEQFLHNYEPVRDGAPSPALLAHELIAAWASTDRMGYVTNQVSRQKPAALPEEVAAEMVSTTFQATPEQVPAHEFHTLPKAIRNNTSHTNTGVTDRHTSLTPKTKFLVDEEFSDHSVSDTQSQDDIMAIAAMNEKAKAAGLNAQEQQFHNLFVSNILLYSDQDGGNIAMAKVTGWTPGHVGTIKSGWSKKMQKVLKIL